MEARMMLQTDTAQSSAGFNITFATLIHLSRLPLHSQRFPTLRTLKQFFLFLVGTRLNTSMSLKKHLILYVRIHICGPAPTISARKFKRR